MSKFTNYFLLMTGIMLLFYVMGLLPADSINGGLLNMLIHPSDLPTSNLSLKSVIAISAITLGSITIGFLLQNLELAIMSAYAQYLFTLLWDFLLVFEKIEMISKYLSWLIFLPILALFTITIVEFWRGREI